MKPASYDSHRLADLAGDLIRNCREMAQLGWTPATSSNFSMRIDGQHVAITVSGRDKGKLVEADIMVVDFDGQPVANELRPSAETLLHTQIYRRFPDIGCILHTHSPNQTIASRLYAQAGHVRLEGYELLKAFRGNQTHEAAIDLPVLPNSQNMSELAAMVDQYLDRGPLWGYLIDGHGIYAWGADMREARRHLDAFEFLLGCELELRKLRQ